MENRSSRVAAFLERFGAGEHDLRALLRTRWVQAALVTAAVVPVLGTVAETRQGVANDVVVQAQSEAELELPPVFASTVGEAWLGKALEREAERLANQYRAQGYRIPQQLAMDIKEAAAKHDIELDIAFGLVRAESSFRNNATSPVGATGLTQLMPRTAAWIEPGTTRADLRNQQRNLDIGFKYLRYLIDKYEGNEDLALLAYNRGQGTVDRALRRGLNPDNGYAAFVRGEKNHGHTLFTRDRR